MCLTKKAIVFVPKDREKPRPKKELPLDAIYMCSKVWRIKESKLVFTNSKLTELLVSQNPIKIF